MLPPQYQISLKPCIIKEIDIMTVTVSELNIQSDFEFTSIITGTFDGLAIWFNVDFDTDTSNSIRLGTGPEDPYVTNIIILLSFKNILIWYFSETHWCQTLLQFNDPIDIKQDDIISGFISIQRMKQQQRSLVIYLTLTAPTVLAKQFIFE